MRATIHGINSSKVYRLSREGAGTSTSPNSLELFPDLGAPHFTQSIFRTADGNRVGLIGGYPSRVHVFGLAEFSLSYSFNADLSLQGAIPLSPDARQLMLWGGKGQGGGESGGRDVTLIHSGVAVDRFRVPHAQRMVAFHPWTAELLSVGSSPDVVRFDLAAGAFQKTFCTSSEDGVEAVDVMSGLPPGLVMAACANGRVEAFDGRQATAAGVLKVGEGNTRVTHVASDGTMRLVAGTEGGVAYLYDIRSAKPLFEKDLMQSLPIVKSYFFRAGGGVGAVSASSLILTADTRSIRVWDQLTGRTATVLEATATLSDFVVLRASHRLIPPYESEDSGVVLMCVDAPPVQVMFVPEMGRAPSYVAHLERVVEEMDAPHKRHVVYEDYRFLSSAELESLGFRRDQLKEVVAEAMAKKQMRPAMHGYFIEQSLYQDLLAVLQPSAFSKAAAQRAAARKETKARSRISKFRRVRDARRAEDASEAMDDAADGVTSAAVRKNEEHASEGPLKAWMRDARFTERLRRDAAFSIDASMQEYEKLVRQLAPKKEKAARRRTRYDEEALVEMPAPTHKESAGHATRRTDAASVDGKSHGESVSRRLERESRGASWKEGKGDAHTFAHSDRQIHDLRRAARQRAWTLEERIRKQRRTHTP